MRKVLNFIEICHTQNKYFKAHYSAGPIGGMGFTMKSGEGKEVKRS